MGEMHKPNNYLGLGGLQNESVQSVPVPHGDWLMAMIKQLWQK